MVVETEKNAQETQRTQASAMEVIARLLEQNNALLKENSELRVSGGGNGGTRTGRAPKRAVRCVDTKTGNVYHSHASAGMAVAPEYGLKVHNFVWYEVIAKDSTRFQDISEERYQAVLKANAEKQAKAAATPPPPTTTAAASQPQKPIQNQGKGK